MLAVKYPKIFEYLAKKSPNMVRKDFSKAHDLDFVGPIFTVHLAVILGCFKTMRICLEIEPSHIQLVGEDLLDDVLNSMNVIETKIMPQLQDIFREIEDMGKEDTPRHQEDHSYTKKTNEVGLKVKLKTFEAMAKYLHYQLKIPLRDKELRVDDCRRLGISLKTSLCSRPVKYKPLVDADSLFCMVR